MSENYNEILIDRVGTDDRVARITLNRPDKLNAWNQSMLAEFIDALRTLESDESARVIIVRGAGRAFSAGWDITPDPTGRDMYAGRAFRARDEHGRQLTMNIISSIKRGAEAQLYMWSMSKVTIAQIHGYCLAGGLEWTGMADLATAANDTILGHPGSRGMGVARNAAMLPLLTNFRKAKEMMLTGDSITGEEAERLGIVNYAWPLEELEERTIALADRVANMSADHLAVTKAATNRFAEAAGIRTAIASATELDAIHDTVSGYEWLEILSTKGIAAALEWRDKPYGDYGFRPR